ncbi:hypothetical protein GJ631_12620 [Natronomonas sp. CBA1123]|jgi:hypothetical protein|uniref:hypothetical protein n=1 Tax=Natronomonas sp. CBA1123 TaxID=2668070 RepID=UPI0012EA8A6C|nr:hypothetical protein [Natronomonas sp. CBA1123]MUV87382.1 hypothetical protein [Natronomonas sp. CBA1123]
MGRLNASTTAVRSALTAAVATPRRVLATLAGNSLLFRALPDGLTSVAGRFGDLLADATVVPFVLAALAVSGEELRLVGAGFDWLLLGYLVYQLLPRLFSDADPAASVIGRRRFRLLATVLVCVFAVPLADQMPGVFSRSVLPAVVASVMTRPEVFVFVFVGWILASSTLIAAYLHWTWWRDAAIDDRVEFMDQIRPGSPTDEKQAEIHDDLTREDWVGPVSNGLGVVSCTLVLVAVCLFLSMAVGFVGILFPLPQVVVLVGVAAPAVGKRLPGGVGPSGTGIRDRAVDIEMRFYRVLKYVSTSRKGLMVAPFFIVGTLLSMLLTLLSFVAIALFVFIAIYRPDVFLSARISVLTRWNIAGYLLCATVPGLFSLWFWVRETERVPQFLQDWERRRPGTASVAAESLPAPATRPPGVLLVPTAFVALFPVFFWIGRQETVPFLPNAAFAVAWPLALGLTVWAVRWTLRADPQPPWTETYALPGAYLLQLLWVQVLFDALDQPLLPTAEFVAVAVGGVVMFFMPDLLSRTDRTTDNGTVQLVLGTGLSGGVLVLFGGVLYLFEQQLGLFAVAGGTVVISLGVVGAGILWLDDRT